MVVEHKHAHRVHRRDPDRAQAVRADQAPVRLRRRRRPRLPAALRPRRRDQGQHRGQPRHAAGPRLRPRDRHRGQRRHLRVDRRQRRRRPARLGRRPLPGVGRADDARHARDPARRRVHDRRAELRRQAAPPVDRPHRPVPRPHRRDGHDGAGAAGRGGDPRAASSTPTATTATPAGTASSAGRSSAGPATLATLHDRAFDRGEPARVSGGQERLENLVASYVGPRPLMALVAGVDSSTSATKVEVRELDSGRVVGARVVAASADAAAAVGAGARGVVGRVRGGVAAGRRASGGGDQRRRPAARHGRARRATARCCDRPSCGTTPSRRPDAAWLIDQLPGGPQAWADACGCVPVASFTITKLSWLHRSEPETWQRLAHVVLPHDWLTFKLTGRLVTDRGDASGTGYWSAATGDVPRRPARRRRRRPGLVGRGADGARARARSPASGRARWSAAGTGDNMAGALGVGLRSGDVAVSIGTSGTVYSVSDEPVGRSVGHRRRLRRRHRSPPPARVHAQRDEGHRRGRAGCWGSTTARSTSWPSPPRRAPGGLVLLPYFDGERTPDRPDATGVLAGIRSDVTREQLARAAVEGVVCGLLDGLDALAAFAPADGRLILLGGGAHSRAYRQVLADLSGRAVLVPARRRAGRGRRVRAGGRRGQRGRAGRCRRPVAAGRRRRRRTGPGRDRGRRCSRRLRDRSGRDVSTPAFVPVRWGVLGCASIATRKVIPAMLRSARCDVSPSRPEIAPGPRWRPPSWASHAPTARTTSCSPTPMSKRCTSRCPTTSTPSGRDGPPPPASTCCARSRSP